MVEMIHSKARENSKTHRKLGEIGRSKRTYAFVSVSVEVGCDVIRCVFRKANEAVLLFALEVVARQLLLRNEQSTVVIRSLENNDVYRLLLMLFYLVQHGPSL